jgi:hypothetical protein
MKAGPQRCGPFAIGGIFAEPCRPPEPNQFSRRVPNCCIVGKLCVSVAETEETMAKGQIKGNKEAKKPKADKDKVKGAGSAYKQSLGKSGPAPSPFTKKT